jgi:hypothetical protein
MSAGGGPATQRRDRTSLGVRSPRRPRPPRRVLRGTLILLAAVAFLALIDAAWVATTANRELRAARDHLQSGASELVDGRIEDARADFVLAGASADRAVAALDHPTGFIGSKLPAIGDDVRAVKDLAIAATLGARAGGSLVRAAHAAEWHGSRAVTLDEGGPSPPSALEAAAPDLDAAAMSLTGRRLP